MREDSPLHPTRDEASPPDPRPPGGAPLELTGESLGRDIARLAMPLMTENLLGLAVFLADGIMVSRLGTVELAGVGLAGHLAFIVSFIPVGFGIGAAALIARAAGRRDVAEASAVLAHAMLAALSFGLAAAAVVFLYGTPILQRLGADPDVARTGATYLRWVAPGILCNVFIRVCGIAFKAAGRPRTPLAVTAFTVVLNIAGNYGLIFGRLGLPEMGVRGAALATTIASASGALLFQIVLSRPGGELRMRIGDLFRIRTGIFRRLVRVSLPALGEIVMNQAGWLLHVFLVTRLGTEALAVFSIGIRTEAISFIPAFSFATVASTLVGQNLGRNHPELARLSLRRASRYALLLMGGMGVVFLLFPDRLVGIFAPKPAVAATAILCVRISSLEQPALALTMTYNGALRGAGDTVSPLWTTAIGTLLLRPILVGIFAYALHGGIAGVWIATIFDWSARATIAILLFRRGRWRRVRV